MNARWTLECLPPDPQQLKYYRGDYDTYERVKTESERLQQRQFEAQQMKREHVQKFIDRFRYKAAR